MHIFELHIKVKLTLPQVFTCLHNALEFHLKLIPGSGFVFLHFFLTNFPLRSDSSITEFLKILLFDLPHLTTFSSQNYSKI